MSDAEVVDCRKRQREEISGQIQHRCMHRDAETYKEVVTPSVCSLCPLRAPARVEIKSQLPVLSHPGIPYAPCEYRIGKTCMASGLKIDPSICSRCAGESAVQEASLVQKFANYASAIRRWVAQGKPERTDEQVKQIFDEHCSKCDMYENGACKSCGCSVADTGFPMTNKLKMKTEVCPLGRWS